MLQKVRSIADNFLMKVLLVMLALAFVGWGVKDALQDSNNFDIVTFKYAPSINNHEFLKTKAEIISHIQKQNQTNFNEEQIKQLGIDREIIERLVNERMLNYLAEYYELLPSENMVVKYLSDLPQFKDDKNNFDIKMLKASMRQSGLPEAEYINNFKKELTKNMIIQIFAEGFIIPKQMTQGTINHLAETYNVNLVKINLNNQKKVTRFKAPTPEELQKFYQDNVEVFSIPERRDVKYLKISSDFLKNKILVSDQEIVNFYNENKEDLEKQTLTKARPQIIEKIKKQKYEQIVIEEARNIEDNVAAGFRLDEIAGRLNLKSQTMQDIAKMDNIEQKYNFNELVDNIFEMSVGEVSYPVELKDKSGILLVEIIRIKPGVVEEYSIVREKVLGLWESNKLKELNYDALALLAKNYNPSQVNLKNLVENGITVEQKLSINRNDFASNKTLPHDLSLAIFQTQPGHNTAVFMQDGSAYFAHIKSKTIDPSKIKEITDSTKSKIEAWTKNGILEELLNYLKEQNEAKVNI